MADLRSRAGTAIAESYYPGAVHASERGVGRVSNPGMRLVAGPEHRAELIIDERHCRWIEGQAQCRSWPVKNKPNPERFCAGHLKKVAATNGPQSPADQGLRTAAP